MLDLNLGAMIRGHFWMSPFPAMEVSTFCVQKTNECDQDDRLR